MQMEVDADLQTYWRSQVEVVKFDDLGDALLHAADTAMCSRSNYRQLVPCSPTSQKNRTVVIVVLPAGSYWITLNCILNKFVLADIGLFRKDLINLTFGNQATIDVIHKGLHLRLLKAVSEFDASLDSPSQTGFINIVVKHLKSYRLTGISPKQLVH
jgi:hypothetical protein